MSHPNHISSEHLPSKNGANGLSGIDPEELEKAVRCGSIDENLDTKHIAEVARFLFSHKDILTQGGFPNIIRANYKGLNLEAHGRPHFITDSLLVIECLNNAINTGEQTSEQRPKKVLILGPGPGRLVIPEIEMAIKLGVKELLFNDLSPDHIDQLREKIAESYGTRDQKIGGVELKFEVGDFVDVAGKLENNSFDAVSAMWFVTPEIADFSSVEALRAKREKLYGHIRRLLTKQGSFIEDVPLSDSRLGGFYYLVRLKTYKVLHDLDILEGENEHCIITSYSSQKGGLPYHIRFAPSHIRHSKEMEDAQLRFVKAIDTLQPVGIRTDGEEAFKMKFGSASNIIDLFRNNTIEAIQACFNEGSAKLLLRPSSNDPLRKVKRTYMFESH